jgi:hypothetical protein
MRTLYHKNKKRKTNKKRKPRPVDDAHKALASGILLQAVEDWKRYKATPEKREELLVFFDSKWCNDLCALALIDYWAMIEALTIPVDQIKTNML